MKIIMLGPPGSGKGTQAAMLSARLNIPTISVGEQLREEIAKGTDLGKNIKPIIDAGKLVPDGWIINILKKDLKKDDIILDGFPRNMEQVRLLESITKIDIAIFIDLSESTLTERISLRRECPNCGRGYHLKYIPPKNDELCDDCNIKLKQRDDDREEVVKNRYRLYKEETEPIIDYYKKKGTLIEIDGENSPEDVFKEIIEKLTKKS